MATSREQIEHFEHKWIGSTWKNFSHSRKWLKQQMNRFLRRRNKQVDEDDVGGKQGKKPFKGYEY